MKRHFWSYALYGLAGFVVSGALAFKIFQPVQVLPRIRLAPAFALTDQNGQRLTSEDLRGHVVLYSFVYTRCEEPRCDAVLETMRAVHEGLADADLRDIPITLITISFDPDHDTPDVLKEYAGRVSAQPPEWYFATIQDKTLLKTVLGGGFEFYYEPREDGTFTFDPLLVLVDGWGVIRGEYRYHTEVATEERILRHLGVLAEEIRNSRGAARVAYEAAHLFLCYAP